jgi:probable rRNA maturation factor
VLHEELGQKWLIAGLQPLLHHEQRQGILNRRFRGHDRATNVLTFVYDQHPVLSGDIALCAPVIEREARASNLDPEARYAHLVVHGMLHLQGYDHANDRDARVMEAREAAILQGFGFCDPYHRQT